jgi:hypothetical protein
MMTWVYSCSCGLVELALEQLRRAADAAERVLDLVRQVADQLAVGLLLFGQLLLARRLQLGVEGAEFEQQAGLPASTGVTVQSRCRGWRAMAMHREVLPGVAPVVGQRIVERRRQARRITAEESRSRPANAVKESFSAAVMLIG